MPALLYADITKKSKKINNVKISSHLLDNLLMFNKIIKVQISKLTLMSPYLYNKKVILPKREKVSKKGR